MPLPRHRLSDLALMLLGVVIAAGVLVLLTRDPQPQQAVQAAAASPLVPSSAGAPAVRVLLLGGAASGRQGEALETALTAATGWSTVRAGNARDGFVVAGPGGTLADVVASALRVNDPDLLVLAADADPAEMANTLFYGARVAYTVDLVRRQRPGTRVVLLAPISAVPGDAAVQRGVLEQVAARFGAFYVDPVGLGWMTGRPGLLTAGGDPTPAGAVVVADRLAASLRQVLPTALIPTRTA